MLEMIENLLLKKLNLKGGKNKMELEIKLEEILNPHLYFLAILKNVSF